MIRLFPKCLLLLVATLGFLALSSIETKAQAPDSIGGVAAVITSAPGTPAGLAGSFRLVASATDNTYGSVGLSGNATSGYGTYTYAKTGPTTGTITYNDTPSGIAGNLVTLTFASPTTGSAVVTNPAHPGQSVNGTFVLSNGQAPASVQGWTFQLQIDEGVAPFATSGSPTIIVADSGDSYQITGETGVSNSSGTYTYATYPSVSPTSSSLTLNDSVLGPAYTQTFVWDTATTGSYVVSNTTTGGFQTGTFVGTPPVTFPVTPSAGANGSISPSSVQAIISDQNATFTASPNAGYRVDQWLMNGTVVQTGGNNFTVMDVTAAATVQVTFQAVAVITISASPPSGGSVSGGGTFLVGSPVSLTATPNAGNLFINWTEGANVASTSPTYNFTAGANRLLVANFVALTPPTIIDSNTATFAVGQAGSFTLKATGYPAPTFSASGLPSWASFNPVTGVLRGTPPDTSGAPYSITVTAANGNSPDADQVFTLNVQPTQTFSDWQRALSTGGPSTFSQGDGIPNLLKYLFDIDPSSSMTAADRAALPALGTTTIEGATYLTLTYRQYPLISGITINVQTSPDLQTWTTLTPTSTPIADTVQVVDSDPTTGDPIVQVQVPTTGARQFIRLNVTQP